MTDFNNIFLTIFSRLNCCRTEKQFYYTKTLQSDRQEKIIQKKYSKRTQIDESSVLEHETFENIQKIFDKLNFLHHQDSNCQLYVDLDVSKQFEFDVMIYHIQDDKNESLDHIIKKNCSKIQSIFFLSKFLTDAETQY